MKISRKFKMGSAIGVTSLLGLLLFQNFTPQQLSQINTLTAQLDTAKPAQSLYVGCENAGSSSDRRDGGAQYKCNEYPIGVTNVGFSPARAAAENAKAKCSLQDNSDSGSDNRRGPRVARPSGPCVLPDGTVLSCPASAYTDAYYNRQLNCTKTINTGTTRRVRKRISREWEWVTEPVYLTSVVSLAPGTYTNQSTDIPGQLAAWNASKTLISQNFSYSDKQGARSVPFYLSVDRAPVVSTVNSVKVGSAAIGFTDFGSQVISKYSGHHFYKNFVDGGSNYIAGCSFFPGMTIRGRQVGGTYTLIKNWLFSYSVGLTLNPGSFSFNNFESCFLLKSNPNVTGDSKVEIVAFKPPKLNGAWLSGFYLDIDLGWGYWLLVALLAAVASFIPIIGSTISATIIASGVTAGAVLSNSAFMSGWVQERLNTIVVSDLASGNGDYSINTLAKLDTLVNTINTSTANVQSGGYLKDIATVGLLRTTVIPALQEQIKIQSRIETVKAQ